MNQYLGVNTLSTNKHRKRSTSRKGSKEMKVVYISSPMKVNTSAAKFQALVQELTGRDSDAERYMDDQTTKGGRGDHQKVDEQFSCNLQRKAADRELYDEIPYGNSVYEVPDFSEFLCEPFSTSGHFELDPFNSFDQI